MTNDLIKICNLAEQMGVDPDEAAKKFGEYTGGFPPDRAYELIMQYIMNHATKSGKVKR